MKRVVWLFAALMTCSITFAQKITVEANQSADADFTKYKTFNWSSQVSDELDPGFYFLNDLVLKAEVRDAVEGELNGRGYKRAESAPDMIVNFRVFEQPATLRGFEGMGDNYWGNNEATGANSQIEYNVKPGTLMVNIVDAKSGQVVWQGFASGLINDNKFIKDKVQVREAANLIFDRFDERADGLSRR
jgi:hypothetical protein